VLRDDQWRRVRRMMSIPMEAFRRAASPNRTQRLAHGLVVGCCHHPYRIIVAITT
jgi:hypothetical protein